MELTRKRLYYKGHWRGPQAAAGKEVLRETLCEVAQVARARVDRRVASCSSCEGCLQAGKNESSAYTNDSAVHASDVANGNHDRLN